jgi:hypothetical protein
MLEKWQHRQKAIQIEFQKQLSLDAKSSFAKNSKVFTLTTPIKADKLEFYLAGYDEVKSQYLLNGITKGFTLEFEGERGYQFSNNLNSAKNNKTIVIEKLSKELQTGRIEGPFDVPPFPNLKISSLGLVPKKSSNQFRLIHHLSYPHKKEGSVNAGISDIAATVQYAGINEAVAYVKEIGNTAFCCKTDIRSAFRILPVAPEDYELLGFCWEDKIYFDKCLPLGCRTSCKIF